MAKKIMVSEEKCTCGPANVLWMIIAVVVLSIGLWLLINGIMEQWKGIAGSAMMVIGWYIGAVLVLWLGKMCKWKSMGCKAHGQCN